MHPWWTILMLSIAVVGALDNDGLRDALAECRAQDWDAEHASCAGIPDLDTSAVTNFDALFRDQASFNLNIGGWNTAAVTSMRDTFAGAAAFDRDLSGWDMSRVTTIEGMFDGATRFNNGRARFVWPHMPHLRSIERTFRNTERIFVQPEIDTSHVVTFARAFEGTHYDGWLDNLNTSSAVNMSAMFRGSPGFGGNFINWDVSRVIDFSSMFEGSVFHGVLIRWDVRNAVNMDYMFMNGQHAPSLHGDWELPSLRSARRMFAGTRFNDPLCSWEQYQGFDHAEAFAGSYKMSACDVNECRVFFQEPACGAATECENTDGSFLCVDPCEEAGGVSVLNKCYTVHNRDESDSVTWSDANTRCAAGGVGSTLAIISNPIEAVALEAAVGSAARVWMGLSKASDDSWVWANGASSIYTRWRPGEPNNYLGSEGCACMTVPWPPVGWNDMPCDRELPYACSRPRVRCSDIGVEVGHKCFFRRFQTASREDASRGCRKHSSTLAVIRNEAEWQAVQSLARSDYRAWIGPTDATDEGQFVNDDGTPLDFSSRWRAGEPNDWAGSGGEDCVVVTDGGSRMNDVSCDASNQYPYICSFE